MSGSRPTAVKLVTVTIDGVTHQGTYFVQGSMVQRLAGRENAPR